MATLYGKSGGGNWSAAGTWSNTGSGGGDSSGPPTAADDCILESGTGNITIDSGAARYCRSLDCQGGTGDYAGTLTHNATTTLTIGDATAGIGNRALRLASGMTYTLGSATTSAITFVSTSATQQTITTAGKTLGDTTFNATSNGSWILSDSLTLGTNTIMTITKGSIDTNGQTLSVGGVNFSSSNTKSITFGTSSISFSNGGWNTSATGTTLSASNSTITSSQSGGTFIGSGLTYGTLNLTMGNNWISGANTFGTLTLTGVANKTSSYTFSANQTVTGTCTITANSKTNRLLITSDTLGTARTLSAGTFSINGCDLRDITKAGAGSGDLSGASDYSGDCGGNTGWTFTPNAAQTATMSTNKSVSDVTIWTSRVPLPQDDVSCAGITGGTLTHDMPRAGKSWDWTGATGNPAWAKTTATTIYGSLTMIGGMTNSGTTDFLFEGRGAFTLTSAGQTLTNRPAFYMFGGTITLQDALSTNNAAAIAHNYGTLDLNGFNVSCVAFNTANSNVRTLTLGSGTLTCTGTGTVFTAATSTNLTVTASTGTIAITDTSGSAKTFAGGGKTWPILSITTGGAGTVTITGANTFTRIVATGGSTKSIVLPGSTTTTLTGTTPFPSGAASNLLTFTASAGSATVSFSNQASCDYVSLTNIIAAGTTPAYAGTHSTDGGGNTNWQFTAPPSGPGFLLRRNQLSGGMSGMGL